MIIIPLYFFPLLEQLPPYNSCYSFSWCKKFFAVDFNLDMKAKEDTLRIVCSLTSKLHYGSEMLKCI